MVADVKRQISNKRAIKVQRHVMNIQIKDHTDWNENICVCCDDIEQKQATL